ncbi:MAG: TetR/AcrR family transcriptional regulator [Spirochaetaceae bacterium]|nr:TetR/AcrR family transcriptional regulator [Spirochaetaceae bacterium]MBO7421545.1 TetR/AcrR family transcriptional regulator [Spirochaetaceae bacterium]
MAIIVEHDKRKHTILDKALDVFVDEGYEDATFQKIADRCGITRTTLYLYFRNKREIFISSIRQLTTNIELDLLDVMHDSKLSSDEKLKQVLHHILDGCCENSKLFTVVLNYLLQVQKTGKNPGTMVRRRIVRLRHLLCNILIEGINKGELSISVSDISTTDEMLYALIESSIFRLAILNQQGIAELHQAIDLAIDGITKK